MVDRPHRAETEHPSKKFWTLLAKIEKKLRQEMGWFWADSPNKPVIPKEIGPKSVTLPHSKQSRCPVDHERVSATSGCPRQPPFRRGFNPLNNMPEIPNEPMLGNSVALGTDREMSSIPMNDHGERWEYPSPQQMYNAISRKGYDGHPDDVPAMVAVHNWLNEGCWQQILRWEKKHFPYDSSTLLTDGWDNDEPYLVKFKGRPGNPTPKSYILQMTGQSPKAFDHHEWFISTVEGGMRRYVIDYYAVDELTFSVDARPALDDFASIRARAFEFAEKMKEKFAGSKGDE